MNVLLDECVPKRLKRDLARHRVSTVEEAGFKGLENGALLRAAEGRYQVLVTVDRSIPKQQNLSLRKLSILILVAPSNKYDDLRRLVPQALEALETIEPGAVVSIRFTG